MKPSNLRSPIFSDSIPQINWREESKNLYVDPGLDQISHYSVYRYCSVAEALLMCGGNISFATPKKWPDKYENHLVERLFSKSAPFSKAVPFVKCFSIEYSSEAMWRIYTGPGGLVRFGIKISELVEALKECKKPFAAKMYIGRVRYMDPAKMRSELDLIVKNKPKAVMANAMPALLMKRSGFSFENELRVAMLPASRTIKHQVVTLSEFPFAKINRLLIDPYLPEWQAGQLISVFKDQLRVPFKVGRSTFDSDPLSL